MVSHFNYFFNKVDVMVTWFETSVIINRKLYLMTFLYSLWDLEWTLQSRNCGNFQSQKLRESEINMHAIHYQASLRTQFSRNSLPKFFPPCNQLFSNLFIKNVIFTNFLPKKCTINIFSVKSTFLVKKLCTKELISRNFPQRLRCYYEFHFFVKMKHDRN